MTKIWKGRIGGWTKLASGAGRLCWQKVYLLFALLLFFALIPTKSAWANTNPTLNDIVASPSTPIALDTQQPVVLTVTFFDPDAGDTHYVLVNWDDGTSCEAHGPASDTTVANYCSIDNGTDTITVSHLYTAPGVYAPTITVATEGQVKGGIKPKQYRYVVVYDDNQGHIKGAGGFDLVHQYNKDNTAYGPAQFGFTLGYNANGTFRSNSRVRFSLYNDDLSEVFTFNSTTFNWLVISRPNAIVSGTGTINGVSYNFVLSIIDGALQSPAGPDRYRIRIVDINNSFNTGSPYYDNEFAPTPTRDIMLFDPTTAIGGGEIVIANAPGAALNGSELIVIGAAPQEVIDHIGQSMRLFIPLAAD
jgi:hypothetical protein